MRIKIFLHVQARVDVFSKMENNLWEAIGFVGITLFGIQVLGWKAVCEIIKLTVFWGTAMCLSAWCELIIMTFIFLLIFCYQVTRVIF